MFNKDRSSEGQKSSPWELAYSLGVHGEVIVHDAGTPGSLLVRDVCSDEAMRIKPHVTDWMSEKQPPAPDEMPPSSDS